MDTKDKSLDDILAHYGVMGMKWGVRRDRSQLKKARKTRKKKGKPVTPTDRSGDAARAREVQKKAKRGGVEALSNQEIQELNTRLNLEQQYSRLTQATQTTQSTQSRMIRGGSKFAQELVVNVGKSQASRLANEAAAKLLKARLGL